MNRPHASVSLSLHASPPKNNHAYSLVDAQWSKSWNPPDDLLAVNSTGYRSDSAQPPPHYALFAPLHYERGYAYPLLVWLHSDDSNERELRRVMPHVSVRNHVAAAVRGSVVDERDLECDEQSDRAACRWVQRPDCVADAAAHVQRVIKIARDRYHVHPRRIYIAGYESGGTMALRVALRHPEWFAGAISLEGPLPQGHAPLARVNRARQLPLLLAACRDSHRYPERRVAGDLRLLHAAGFALSLRQYPGDHELTTEMLADMDRWMLEQFCNSASITA